MDTRTKWVIAALLVLVLAFLVIGGIIAIASPPNNAADPCVSRDAVRSTRMALVPTPNDPASLTSLLAREGFIAAAEEAEELLAYAAGDPALLDASVRRRLTGEPLAWITGGRLVLRRRRSTSIPTSTCRDGSANRSHAGRSSGYPPTGLRLTSAQDPVRSQKVLRAHRPGARVVASDVDPRAVACAAANGVEVYQGDLFEPSATRPRGSGRRGRESWFRMCRHAELPLLQRDTFTFETPLSYDGGADGTDILRRVARDSPRFLRHGGALLLELGGDQAELLADELTRLGYAEPTVLTDEDGDVRGIEATLGH